MHSVMIIRILYIIPYDHYYYYYVIYIVISVYHLNIIKISVS
jgi:hypothetical protein